MNFKPLVEVSKTISAQIRSLSTNRFIIEDTGLESKFDVEVNQINENLAIAFKHSKKQLNPRKKFVIPLLEDFQIAGRSEALTTEVELNKLNNNNVLIPELNTQINNGDVVEHYGVNAQFQENDSGINLISQFQIDEMMEMLSSQENDRIYRILGHTLQAVIDRKAQEFYQNSTGIELDKLSIHQAATQKLKVQANAPQDFTKDDYSKAKIATTQTMKNAEKVKAVAAVDNYVDNSESVDKAVEMFKTAALAVDNSAKIVDSSAINGERPWKDEYSAESKNVDNQGDAPVLYDYSDSKMSSGKKEDKKTVSSQNKIVKEVKDGTSHLNTPISEKVRTVIDREIQSQFAKTQAMAKGPKIAQKSVDVDNNDEGQENSSEEKKTESILEKGESQLTIKVAEAALGKGFKGQGYNFEFLPEYDKNQRYYDYANGEIKIKSKLNNSSSVIRGTVLKKDKVPTKVDIAVEEGQIEVFIPLFDEGNWSEFISENGLNGGGGHLLIDLHEQVDIVDIDGQYEGKLFLNEKLRKVDGEGSYRYILFEGINPGNVLLSYKTFDGQVAQKIIHITETEIYFESNDIKDSALNKISLFEQNIFSSNSAELNIDASKISYFGQDAKVRNIGINLYEYQRPKLPMGMRQYLELNHLNGTIFVGLGDQDRVEVPGQQYVSQVFNALNLQDLQGRCLIQVNLSKKMLQFQAEGEGRQGAMNLEKYFLDLDGQFSKEGSEMARQIFLAGDGQGIINGKISYIDGTVDYFQTFCSEDTYLVEHL
ncbi:MAG: hypothetical protein WCG27_05425 [Pseudomonadota bacterium]